MIDDDVHSVRMVQQLLELEGYHVVIGENGDEAVSLCYEHEPDLIILDIMMPGADGYDACARIREFSQVPIIMLTAKDDDAAKIRGLDAGADDYVTKPFSSQELLARLRSALRRQESITVHDEPTAHIGDLTIDYGARRVSLGDREIILTGTEFALLTYFVQNAGRIITPNQILEHVWGAGYSGESHILQVNIARLRSKLAENAHDPKYIKTRPGIGYILVKPE